MLLPDRVRNLPEGIKEGLGMQRGKIGEKLAAAEEDCHGSYIPLQCIRKVRIAFAEGTEILQSPLGVRGCPRSIFE
jgi:hypothetical protein